MDTPATPATPIGERIEELLGTLDKTPSWLASTVGVPRSTVHRILKGQRQPTAQTLAEFAMALGMQLEHLVVGTDAAARVSEAANLVSRDLHEQVVSKMIEFESQPTNDLTRRPDSLELEIGRTGRHLGHWVVTTSAGPRSGNRVSIRLAFGLAPVIGIRTEAERLREE